LVSNSRSHHRMVISDYDGEFRDMRFRVCVISPGLGYMPCTCHGCLQHLHHVLQVSPSSRV